MPKAPPKHTPITREQKVAGVANSVAFDTRRNLDRAERLKRIEKIHGAKFAAEVRQMAWQAIRLSKKHKI